MGLGGWLIIRIAYLVKRIARLRLPRRCAPRNDMWGLRFLGLARQTGGRDDMMAGGKRR